MVLSKIDSIVMESGSSAKSICQALEGFAEINLLAKSDSYNRTLELISTYSPKLVFVDIGMKDEAGLKLVQNHKTRNFDIVIIADNSEYATIAFKYSVLHYLVKPISQYQIKQVISRILEKPQHFVVDRISVEHETVKSDNNRIYLLTKNGINVVNVDEIMFCEENKEGTLVYLKNEASIQASESLSVFESLPALSCFSKINQLQLINLNFIKNVINSDCSRAILENDKNLFISEACKVGFLNKISEIAIA